ncbi:MAG: IspD/TarI family cytidylyltransferase [Nocardioidaceae bacterium]
MRTAVVALAAGSGARVGAGTNKVLLELRGVPLLCWSLRTIQQAGYGDRVVLAHRPGDADAVSAATQRHVPGLDPLMVPGGETRHASEWAALRALAEPVGAGLVDVIAVHDTARPLADVELWRAVVEAAYAHGGALPVRPQPGLIRTEGAGRDGLDALVAVQTPQAFRAAPLLEAYRRADRDGFAGTDTAACVERYADLDVVAVSAPASNLKVTFPEDLALAERLQEALRASR